MSRSKQMSLYLMASFYVLAGVNHFINPEFYLPLIPSYFPFPNLINIIAGIVEIAFGIGLISSQTRQLAAYGIILMLIAFIPSHTYFIQIGSCIDGGLCVPEWVGWIRLLIIHPVLIWWAWVNR